jgi:hypothetical protein
VAQRIRDRHAPTWLNLQQPEDEIQSYRRTQVALLLEQRGKVPLLEQEPVRVLLCGISAHKERLRREQVESAPAQAPRVHLRSSIHLLLMQLWRPEGFAHQTTEVHRQFLALLIKLEDDCLTWVADFDLVMPSGFLHMQQHVLQRHILHGHVPLMQKR